MKRQDYQAKIRELLDANQTEALRALVNAIDPAEIEECFGDLEREERELLLRLLEPEAAAEVLGSADEHIQDELTETLSHEEIAELVEAMDSDEAADTVRRLEPEQQGRVLELLEDETEDELRQLLTHDEDTAGDLMMAELPAVREEAIVAEVIEFLREHADEYRELYEIYVVDAQRRLRGVLPLRDLVLARPGMPLKAVMSPATALVTPSMDQEEVAGIFRKYDMVSLPVVDEDGVLVGRITVDDILDVIEDEASEDISRLAGLGEESFRPLGLFRLTRERLPWLILGLAGGLLSARIIKSFQGSLAQMLQVAFFIPVITALGGNIGIQSSTIIVRGLATGEVRSGGFWARILREASISVLNGLVIGLLTFLVVTFWLDNPPLGVVVSVSMLSVVLWATLTGTLVPLGLRRLGFDPAYATGPFVTTTNDIVDLSIYMGIAFHYRHLLA